MNEQEEVQRTPEETIDYLKSLLLRTLVHLDDAPALRNEVESAIGVG